MNNWFCNGKEGCDWRNQFDEFWQKILLKGELGDALAYSWHEGNPVFAVFALQDGMLIGWDLNSKTAQSVPGLASKSQNERLALYRSQNANLDGGPTQSSFWPISNIWIENTNLLLANYNGAYITQFTQPDTIIPDPYNTLDWNRYSYVRYNPLKYSDPSGHFCYNSENNKFSDGDLS